MSQSLTQIWTHIIFSTKERYPFLKDDHVRQRLYDYIDGICRGEHCQLVCAGGIEDHVHILINLNKNISISQLIEKIKKSSSKWIKTINNKEYDKFYWQRGYGAFSVSQSSVEATQLYIQTQKNHHKNLTFKDEFIKFLNRYGVNYNEKYLWD